MSTWETEGTSGETFGPFPAGPVHDVEGPRYRLHTLLGRGGMGEVWRAEDRVLEREVALKLMRPDRLAVGATHFLAEARRTAGLQHPAICPVYDTGIYEDGRVFYTMAVVDGERLDEWAAGQPLLRMGAAFLQLCEAVAYAHSRGIVHRDLKPSNALVAGHGRLYIIDWGLAALIGAPTSAAGTPNFMAPEQQRGECARPQSDVWALGRTLAVLLQDRSAPVLEDLVRHCTEAEVDARPASASDVEAAVRRWLDGARKASQEAAAAAAADLAFDRLDAQESCRGVLLRLVDREGHPRDGRRSSFPEPLLDALSGARLVDVDAQMVRLAGGVLPAWHRLSRWIRADPTRHHMMLRIASASETWHTATRDPALLWDGEVLDALLAHQRSGLQLLPAEQSFLDASLALRARRRRRSRALALAGIAGLAITTTLSILAAQRAEQARMAEQTARHASELRGMLFAAREAEATQLPHAAAALHRAAESLGGPARRRAQLEEQLGAMTVLDQHDAVARGIAITPEVLHIVYEDGTLRRRDRRTGELLETVQLPGKPTYIEHHNGDIWVQLSASGKVRNLGAEIWVVTDEPTLLLEDVIAFNQADEEFRALLGDGSVYAGPLHEMERLTKVSASRRGRIGGSKHRVAVSLFDARELWWFDRRSNELTKAPGNGHRMVSSGDDYIVVTDFGGRLTRSWDDGRETHLDGLGSPLFQFNEDDRTFHIDVNGRVTVLDEEDQIIQSDATVRDVRGWGSANEELLAWTAGTDIMLASAATGVLIDTFTGHTAAVTWIQVDDDGLWSASEDGTARHWAIPQDVAAAPCTRRFGAVEDHAHRLMLHCDDDIVRVSPDRLERWPANGPTVFSVNPHPDGGWLEVGDHWMSRREADGTTRWTRPLPATAAGGSAFGPHWLIQVGLVGRAHFYDDDGHRSKPEHEGFTVFTMGGRPRGPLPSMWLHAEADRIERWEVDTLTRLETRTTRPLVGMLPHPRGTYSLGVQGDGRIEVFDADGHIIRELTDLGTTHVDQPRGVATAPSMDWWVTRGDNGVRMHRYATDEQRVVSLDGASSRDGLYLLEHEDRLHVLVSGEGSWEIWDLEREQRVHHGQGAARIGRKGGRVLQKLAGRTLGWGPEALIDRAPGVSNLRVCRNTLKVVPVVEHAGASPFAPEGLCP